MPGDDLRTLAEEQAALKRVAVTVATESAAERVFDVVTEEVARLVGADAANLVSFGPAPDEGVIVGKWSEPGVRIPDAGTVVQIEPGAPFAEVARTGGPVRMATDDPSMPRTLQELLISLGVTSVVAAPIVVAGEIWGALAVSVTRDLTFAPNAEERLGQFAGLVAVAIANAQAREELATLADEQAALSRVAVAVATEERPEQLFSVVSEEIGRLFGADAGATVRYVDDMDGAVIVGAWQRVGEFDPPLGVRLPFEGGAIARVAQTGRAARIDLETEPAELRERMLAAQVSSGVAAPIMVSGRLWGATSLSNSGGLGRFPPDVETRLEKFTSLIAVALANAEAREELAGLAQEQAALSRVAVAVATEERPERLFSIVSEEIGRLFGADAAATARYVDDEGDVEMLGLWQRDRDTAVPLVVRLPIQGGAIARVAQTGRSARIDLENEPPDVREHMTAAGVGSGVAAPIVVSGRLWGATSISIGDPGRFPRGMEERLEKFTSLTAVALANAQAREELATLADEQAALSRVAVAVATEERPEQLFSVVSEEIGQLFGARVAATVRFVDDADEVEVMGGWQLDGRFDAPFGVRQPFQGGAIVRVARTGRAARIDLENEPPDVHELMEAAGVSSGVAAPIVVSGRLWGATTISTFGPERFPPDAEERLGKFTSLVAVALANAEAREELAALAREQAALSRVAVAAATERPARLFDIVTEEVGRLFGGHWASTTRYLGDSEVELVGRWHRTGDHSLEVGSRVSLRGGVLSRVRETGGPARLDYEQEPPEVQEMMRSDGVASGVAAPIVVSGRLWGAISISVAAPDAFGVDVELQVAKFTSLVAVALANAEAGEQLTASRARIVQAGDAERRRLERNLHDGAQQRLVSLSLRLRIAESRLPDDPAAAAALIAEAGDELALGLEELRELARGIHPAVLTDHGLTPAVEALAARATFPVEVNGLPPERLAEPIEAAAFYVVSESLANVAKYAAASHARVDLVRNDGVLVVEVADDGVGGADAAGGTGLRGLSDRVEALGGHLHVSSEQGRGTTVRAELPIDVER